MRPGRSLGMRLALYAILRALILVVCLSVEVSPVAELLAGLVLSRCNHVCRLHVIQHFKHSKAGEEPGKKANLRVLLCMKC